MNTSNGFNNSKGYSIWLENAYQLFAVKGPECFSIKELAHQCNLPRTNFYYYFTDKDDIIGKVIEHHLQIVSLELNCELEKRMHTFIPDLYEVVYDFKLGIRFAKQLFKNREDPYYNNAYRKALSISSQLIVPKFQEYFELELPEDEMSAIWYTLTDAWFSRLSFDDYTVESLTQLTLEIWKTIAPLTNNKNQLEEPH